MVNQMIYYFLQSSRNFKPKESCRYFQLPAFERYSQAGENATTCRALTHTSALRPFPTLSATHSPTHSLPRERE